MHQKLVHSELDSAENVCLTLFKFINVSWITAVTFLGEWLEIYHWMCAVENFDDLLLYNVLLFCITAWWRESWWITERGTRTWRRDQKMPSSSHAMSRWNTRRRKSSVAFIVIVLINDENLLAIWKSIWWYFFFNITANLRRILEWGNCRNLWQQIHYLRDHLIYWFTWCLIQNGF